MLTSVCVRWHAGRASWRPAAELFEAAAFEVATIDSDTTARAFVVPAHYSHSYPAARRRFGLYTRRHRGNHRYAWGLTPAARRDLLRATAALTYPKFNARACRVAPTVNTTCTTRPT